MQYDMLIHYSCPVILWLGVSNLGTQKNLVNDKVGYFPNATSNFQIYVVHEIVLVRCIFPVTYLYLY